LVADIDAALRDRIDKRVEAEQRTLRVVVERALVYYLDNVPVDAGPSINVPQQPKRGRPPVKKKGG
jgi:hypothetical protein